MTADLAFFVSPAIADVDGDGHNEVIAGNGVFTICAHRADGSRPAEPPLPPGQPEVTFTLRPAPMAACAAARRATGTRSGEQLT